MNYENLNSIKFVIVLLAFFLHANYTIAQDCKKMKIKVLNVDTISSINHACLTFYSNDGLIKQIWWDKKDKSISQFAVGESFKVKIRKVEGVYSFYNNELMRTYSCYGNEYYVNGIKHESYEICK